MATTGGKVASLDDVADYFIANAKPDKAIVRLKLEKLCCYAQAYFLALHGCRLFDCTLKAWRRGPVLGELCAKYDFDDHDPVSTSVRPGGDSRRQFTYEQLFVLKTVNEYYGRYDPDALSAKSHIDFPGDFNDSRLPIPDAAIAAKFKRNEIIKAIRAGFR